MMKKDSPDSFQSTIANGGKQVLLLQKNNTLRQAIDICGNLQKKPGVHSVITMKSAGFHYVDNGDTTRCNACGLEVSGWTSDTEPFSVHAQDSPQCPYVLSILPHKIDLTPTTANFHRTISTTYDDENSRKRQNIEVTQEICQSNRLIEIKMLNQIRKRTFSHWPHRISPSPSQMIEAGFFYCNIDDRVICLYCNLICHQWVPGADDPWIIHKTLSPRCPYFISKLKHQHTTLVPNINEYSPNDYSLPTNATDSFLCNEMNHTDACHPDYAVILSRYASFATWPSEDSPAMNDLVPAGFFYTGNKTIVTCFYCNGSLENLKINDNSMIEHVRWFPNCAYAKQFCDAELYRNIQQSNQSQQECDTSSHEDYISDFIKARLDLPISKALIADGFDLSIIKKCYENQLRLVDDDFANDSDLRVACILLQKQIQYIDGKKENIIIPSKAMIKIHTEMLTSSQD